MKKVEGLEESDDYMEVEKVSNEFRDGLYSRWSQLRLNI